VPSQVAWWMVVETQPLGGENCTAISSDYLNAGFRTYGAEVLVSIFSTNIWPLRGRKICI